MKVLRIISIILLIFNGLSAIVGGYMLIADPTGRLSGIPLSVLKHSPFDSFLIPGSLLFVFNGISSMLIALLAVRKCGYYSLFIALQGIASIIWIVTQVIMIRAAVWLHYLYGGIGVVLLVAGIILAKHTARRRR